MDIYKEYDCIKTPQELLEFMDKYISYGIYGTDNKIYTDGNLDKYIFSDYKRLLDFRYGNCFDQVELERNWFTKHNLEFKTYFVFFQFNHPNNYPTHTYLVYKDNDNYYLFEHAFYKNRGIHKYNSYLDAIKSQLLTYLDYTKSIGNKLTDEEIKHIHIYEYNPKEYKVSMDEFMDNILTFGKEIKID